MIQASDYTGKAREIAEAAERRQRLGRDRIRTLAERMDAPDRHAIRALMDAIEGRERKATAHVDGARTLAAAANTHVDRLRLTGAHGGDIVKVREGLSAARQYCARLIGRIEKGERR